MLRAAPSTTGYSQGGSRIDCPSARSMMADKPTQVSRGELLPVLPLRDIVVFPHMIVPLFVGREKSVRALEAVMRENKQILLVAQKNAAQDDPEEDDLFSVGTVSTVLQLLKLPDGTVKVLVEGGRRARDRKSTRLNSSHA